MAENDNLNLAMIMLSIILFVMFLFKEDMSIFYASLTMGIVGFLI